ncbi:MAG: flagellar motor protein MotB [Candidatus Hinthialibacter antarcticus]|nr:flagellar motor protein MotB [Candidatus Hinthialibacter antarcticus]
MAGRKPEEKKGGAPEWMCTFSDMMSLLLCFFVLLFSLSTIEKKKLIQASGSLKGAFGGMPAPYVVPPIPDKKTQPEMSRPAQPVRKQFYGKEEITREEARKVKSKNLDHMIQVTGTEQGITFRLSGDFSFAQGNSELLSEGILALQFIADEISQFPNNPIKVDGHTDNTKRRSDPDYNWRLAADRAYTVLEFLVNTGSERNRVDKRRFSYESFSDTKPLPDVDPNQAIGRSLNRRVEITLIQTDQGFGTTFEDTSEKNPRTPLISPALIQEPEATEES